MIINENPNIKLGKNLKMKMNNEFKEWLTGIFVLFLMTFTAYSFNRFMFPTNYFNFLEWFGIIMAMVILKTGIDSYKSND